MRVEPLVLNNQGPEQTVQQKAKQFQESRKEDFSSTKRSSRSAYNIQIKVV